MATPPGNLFSQAPKPSGEDPPETSAAEPGAQEQNESGPDEFCVEFHKQVEQMRSLASALILNEQRERNRVSRILYDDLQQLLFGSLIRLELLNQSSSAEGDLGVQEQVDQITHQVNQAIDITRFLVVELAPPVLEAEGLEEALHWLTNHMEENYELKIDLSILGRSKLRNSNIRTLLLQAVRELLYNVIEHADTGQAQVILNKNGDTVTIQIKDEGRGFDINQIRERQKQQKSSGLFNVENWLNLIGGRLDIDSKPGQGTRMTIVAPPIQI